MARDSFDSLSGFIVADDVFDTPTPTVAMESDPESSLPPLSAILRDNRHQSRSRHPQLHLESTTNAMERLKLSSPEPERSEMRYQSPYSLPSPLQLSPSPLPLSPSPLPLSPSPLPLSPSPLPSMGTTSSNPINLASSSPQQPRGSQRRPPASVRQAALTQNARRLSTQLSLSSSSPPRISQPGNYTLAEAIEAAERVRSATLTSATPERSISRESTHTPNTLSRPPPTPPVRPQWKKNPMLTEDLALPIQRAIDRIPTAHLFPPRDGETFSSREEGEERLINWSLFGGFAIVIISGDENVARFKCIHWRTEARNTHELDDHAERGGNRKRENTAFSGYCCPWQVRLSFVQKHQRSTTTEKVWRLKVTNSTHSHDEAPNPLLYEQHKARLPETGRAIDAAIKLRLAKVRYGDASNVLALDELRIERKKFYRLCRDLGLEDHSDKDPLEDIEQVLTDLGYVWRARYSYTIDSNTGHATHRSLEQIAFWLPEQEILSQRFISNFCCQIDATFDTNRTRLLLGIITGVTNAGDSFTAAYSYFKSESAENWTFFIDAVAERHWDPQFPPKVVISDQGKGLIAALPESSLRDAVQQFCQWHAHHNISTRIGRGAARGKGYTVAKRNLIRSLIWPYLQADTVEELKERRESLLAELNAEDKVYMMNQWVSIEEKLITCHVKKLPNLGANSTQRGESNNNAVQGFTNHSLPMKEALLGIKKYTNQRISSILEHEQKSHTKGLRLLQLDDAKVTDCELAQTLGDDLSAFNTLRQRITNYALKKLYDLYRQALTLHLLPEDAEERTRCECDSLTRYGLPCKHLLLPVVQDGAYIPESLIHPRWLQSSSWHKCAKNWKPSYTKDMYPPQEPSERPADIDRIRLALLRVVDKVAELNPNELASAAVAIETWSDQYISRLGNIHKDHSVLLSKPFENPPKTKWQPDPKNQHGKADIRQEATAKVAETTLNRRQATKSSKSVTNLSACDRQSILPHLTDNILGSHKQQESRTSYENAADGGEDDEHDDVDSQGEVQAERVEDEIIACSKDVEKVQNASEQPVAMTMAKEIPLNEDSSSSIASDESEDVGETPCLSGLLPTIAVGPSRRSNMRQNRTRLDVRAILGKRPQTRSNTKRTDNEFEGVQTRRKRNRQNTIEQGGFSGSPKKGHKSPQSKRRKGKQVAKDSYDVCASGFEALKYPDPGVDNAD